MGGGNGPGFGVGESTVRGFGLYFPRGYIGGVGGIFFLGRAGRWAMIPWGLEIILIFPNFLKF